MNVYININCMYLPFILILIFLKIEIYVIRKKKPKINFKSYQKPEGGRC